MRRVQFTLTGADELLAEGYEADRNIPLCDLARSALLSAIKREAGRSGLLDAVRQIVREEMKVQPQVPRASARGHDLAGSKEGTAK
jgi:hypothetical protein